MTDHDHDALDTKVVDFLRRNGPRSSSTVQLHVDDGSHPAGMYGRLESLAERRLVRMQLDDCGFHMWVASCPACGDDMKPTSDRHAHPARPCIRPIEQPSRDHQSTGETRG